MARGRPQVTFNKGHKVLPSMFFRATTSPVLYQRQLDKRSGSHISSLLPKNHFYWSHHIIGLKPKLHLSTAPRPLNVLRTIGNITSLVNHKNPSEEMWDIWNLAFRRHQIPPFRKKIFATKNIFNQKRWPTHLMTNINICHCYSNEMDKSRNAKLW